MSSPLAGLSITARKASSTTLRKPSVVCVCVCVCVTANCLCPRRAGRSPRWTGRTAAGVWSAAGCGISPTSHWATTRRPGGRAARDAVRSASRAAPEPPRGRAMPGRRDAARVPCLTAVRRQQPSTTPRHTGISPDALLHVVPVLDAVSDLGAGDHCACRQDVHDCEGQLIRMQGPAPPTAGRLP